MALRLHAVTAIDSADRTLPLEGVARPVAFRDLAAIVTDREKFVADDPDETVTNEHRAIVDAIFKSQVVLPTPVGIMFRDEDVLTRWMELHYVTLTDALSFVHDRVGARVHVSRRNADESNKLAGSDLAEASSEIFRTLRRTAVASMQLTTEQVTGIVLSGAFLVERERWGEFETAFADARRENGDWTVELTGPWAPYDFVRMQFDD